MANFGTPMMPGNSLQELILTVRPKNAEKYKKVTQKHILLHHVE